MFLYYILMPLGIVFTLLNSVILFINSHIQTFDFFISAMLALQIFAGILMLIFNHIYHQKAIPLYIGLLSLCCGVLNILVYLSSAFGIVEFWPLFVILAGILLMVSGVYKYKKLKFGFVIPSFTLIGMGGWFLLFSFKIIKLSFLDTAAILGPIFMLMIAVLLVLLFLAQQKHKELIIKDDNLGTFDDEDVPLNKIDD